MVSKLVSKRLNPGTLGDDVCPKGDQSWVFIGRTDAEAETPMLWLPHVKG